MRNRKRKGKAGVVLIRALALTDTTGGPHWAALDNFHDTASGAPTRLLFAN